MERERIINEVLDKLKQLDDRLLALVYHFVINL